MVIPCAGCSTELRFYQILNARLIFENLQTYCGVTVLIKLNTPLILQQKITPPVYSYTIKNTLLSEKYFEGPSSLFQDIN